jgi:replication factor C subunit 1
MSGKFLIAKKIVITKTPEVALVPTPVPTLPVKKEAFPPVTASSLFSRAKALVQTQQALETHVPHVVIKRKITIKPNPVTESTPSQESGSIPYNPEYNLWSEKYRPRTLNQIIGNTSQITEIADWFKKFIAKDNTIKKALLFSGCPGTSKTTVAHAVLKEFGFSIKEYNASDVRSKKLVESNLDKLITMDQVDKHFRENFRPFGIIMDEVDGMSSGDKGGMSQLIKIINPNRGKRSVKKEDKQKANDRWIPPIICICNNNYDKKISELKKDCLEIKFTKPTNADLTRIIDNICHHEKIQFDEGAKKVICDLSQGDFRRLVFLLQNFSNIKKDIIASNDIYEYYDIANKKSLDLNTYELTNRIFVGRDKKNRYRSVEETLKIYETDKSLLPMMIHENYVDVINSQMTDETSKMLNCQQSIDSIINGDIIEKIMYNTQSWHLQPIHGLASCYIPGYYSTMSATNGHSSAKWTNTLGRFSLQRSNIKNIHLVISMLNSGQTYNVNDIHLLSGLILFHLLDPAGDQNIGIKYLKNYNLSVNDLEKLIKMNKLNDKYKKLYKSRQKTQLTKLFGDFKQKEIPTIVYNSSSSSVAGSRTFSLGKDISSKRGKKKKDDDDDGDGDGDGDGDDVEDDLVDDDNDDDNDNDDDDNDNDESSEIKVKAIKKPARKSVKPRAPAKPRAKKAPVPVPTEKLVPKQKIQLKKLCD